MFSFIFMKAIFSCPMKHTLSNLFSVESFLPPVLLVCMGVAACCTTPQLRGGGNVGNLSGLIHKTIQFSRSSSFFSGSVSFSQ